jgi:hypothetical protein
MSFRRCTWLGGLGLALAAACAVHAASTPAELARRAAVIEPAPEEMRWQQIPWVSSLVEARQAARQEGRPVFLWVTSDPPLDRC